MRLAALILISALALWAQPDSHPHVQSLRVDFAARELEFVSAQFDENEKPAKKANRREWSLSVPNEYMRLKGARGAQTRFFDDPEEAGKVERGLASMRATWDDQLRPCIDKPQAVLVATLHPFEDLIDVIMDGGARLEVRSGAALWRDRKPCDLKDPDEFYSQASAAVKYATISVMWWDEGHGGGRIALAGGR